MTQVFDTLAQVYPTLVAYEDRTNAENYSVMDCCTQYRETDFNFVSRLMEQEGIFYYFVHEGDKHTLVLADDSSHHNPCPGDATVSYQHLSSPQQSGGVVTGWSTVWQLQAGGYVLRDHPPVQQPDNPTEFMAPTAYPIADNSKLELIDYYAGLNARFNHPDNSLQTFDAVGRRIAARRSR